ncbi:gamma-glutamylcyclotransferase [Chitinibacter sp. S2-10]|uniref:gamma-glutamylcyclotransferase family protein n=1 Tax=Chitinibacter sp. S2-10 TaxID=3373597 RepID=UPI00397759B2
MKLSQRNGEYLFVYGTLKRGFSNHHYLKTARYIDEAKTQQAFALYTIEYPFLAKTPILYQVQGELYLIDNDDLVQVDLLEQHPDDYCRELIEVVTSGGQIVNAWTYFHPHPQGRLLEHGLFIEQ